MKFRTLQAELDGDGMNRFVTLLCKLRAWQNALIQGPSQKEWLERLAIPRSSAVSCQNMLFDDETGAFTGRLCGNTCVAELPWCAVHVPARVHTTSSSKSIRMQDVPFIPLI